MRYHVLPGDAQREDFAASGIEGEVIVFREALISGPADTSDIDLFWEERAQFIFTEYGEDPIDYHDKVANEIARLEDIPDGSDVTLWFEYELFCSVNMWFCLARLQEKNVTVYRSAPKDLSPENVWDGFANHSAEMLADCFEARIQFSDEDIAIGSRLWHAFGSRDSETLKELGDHRSPCFPFLKEVCEAAASIDTLPLKVIREIRAEKISDFDETFMEFKSRAGVYGFGDLQVERLLERA